MNSSRTIIVYRDDLLGASETFVLAQGESLRRFRPFYLGLRRCSGLGLPDRRVHIISRDGLLGKPQRARFKLMGPGRSLLAKLARMRPALIHAHFGPDACHAAPLAQALGIPLVVSFHGYDVTAADDHLPQRYVQHRDRLKQTGARFICVSDFVRRRVLAKGFPAEKTIVHYTGIDTQFFRAEPSVSRDPVVLFVGRLVPKKGCEYLIRAMAEVQGVMPEANLIVIGDGPLRQELERQAAAILKRFEFLGVQAPSVVRDWMNRARVFSTPSVIAESGDAEGFGMVFAEAQAMGLPVVSFASGGIPEAVAHEETGFLVRERDCEGLAAKLLLVLGNRDLWSRLSEAGRSRVLSLFDIRKQALRLEDLYEGVLVEAHSDADPAGAPIEPSYAWSDAHA